jgi:cellulose synthase/poly-beta-1,6-N-acetylglucosamine synthase-like glycosyltransferase
MTYALISFQWVFALPLTVALVYFALETLLGLKPLGQRPPKTSGAAEEHTAVLIPAHNEAAVIIETVTALRASAPLARILVVADNCSDETARYARAAGAEVAERHDLVKRGKGYALDHGRARLASDPPACVVILDADCRIVEHGVAALASEVARTGGAVQAANLVIGDAEGRSQAAISNFAMMVKNLFRARGMARLGGGVLLFGTGMAFPWRLFEDLQLATGDATEDIALGLDLARAGAVVTLADHVRVTSPPADAAGSRGQRTRWEHGFLKSMQRAAIPMLASGLAQRSPLQTAVGLHMMVPPLALLVALALAVLGLVGALMLLGGSVLPVALLAAAIALAAMAVAAAWLAGGREVLPGASLFAIPLYILWKIPIYIAYLVKPNNEWNRTRRDGENG